MIFFTASLVFLPPTLCKLLWGQSLFKFFLLLLLLVCPLLSLFFSSSPCQWRIFLSSLLLLFPHSSHPSCCLLIPYSPLVIRHILAIVLGVYLGLLHVGSIPFWILSFHLLFPVSCCFSTRLPLLLLCGWSRWM